MRAGKTFETPLAMLGVVWILIFQIRSIPMMHMGASPGLYSTEYLVGGGVVLLIIILGAWKYRTSLR